MNARSAYLCALLAAFAAGPAGAHRLNESYLYLQIYEDTVTGRFEIALSDLNPALGLSGTDREITSENLDRHVDFLKAYYLEKVTISGARGPLAIQFTEHRAFLEGRGGYAALSFDLGGMDAVPDVLTFDYSVLFDEDPTHRGFLLVEHNWATGTFANESGISLVFSPDSTRHEFDLTSSGRLRGFMAVVGLGAEHVWHGLDHLAFLLALLLPAVLRRRDGKWQPANSFKPAFSHAAKIVIVLLIAHGIALCLVVLAGVHLPERLVEVVIAASIAVAAADILFPLFKGRIWWIVLGLGLFHGFGFAGALSEMGVLREHRGLSLAAYNLGVEGGQLVVVAILVPIFFLFRRLSLYRKVALPVAAVAMILVAGIWVAERAFDVDVPMRELLPPAVRKVIP